MYFHDFMIDRFKSILYLCKYTVPLYNIYIIYREVIGENKLDRQLGMPST